jgi:hypothetical protein
MADSRNLNPGLCLSKRGAIKRGAQLMLDEVIGALAPGVGSICG